MFSKLFILQHYLPFRYPWDILTAVLKLTPELTWSRGGTLEDSQKETEMHNREWWGLWQNRECMPCLK